MERINVHEAKERFSHDLERGEVFTICRNNVPVAEPRAHDLLSTGPAEIRRIARWLDLRAKPPAR